MASNIWYDDAMQSMMSGDDRPWIEPENADPDGLVGVGGDLSAATLVKAYTDGVFPWFNEGDPILWWSPDPRAIIEFDGLHISHSLARTLRKGRFQVTVNRCFEQVMRSCGDSRPEGTWVTETMLKAYVALHRLGFAHSLETWVDGELAGGIYGVSIGRLFAAESMFFRITDGSKVALVKLVERLRERGYELLDVQMTTEHTERMGAVEIPRAEYLQRLRDAVMKPARFA
jgi:leucyl/phenylalanyl-tRNA---protein transferase